MTKMKIYINAKPNAKQNKVSKIDEKHYKVCVKEPPIKGLANKAIINLLAEYFQCPKSKVKIISGFRSKSKTAEIAN